VSAGFETEHRDETLANARLIEAAPEMYEVLNAMFSWMVEGWPEEWPDEHSITAPLTVGDVRRARALLAKVKGEQPEKGNDK
jgi:hypothetical protein